MSKIDKAVEFIVGVANDNSHGYSQNNRWGTPDYDCSSLVISAWEHAGVPVKTRGATYTGNMYAVFKICGFEDVTASVNLFLGTGLQNGDVLLNHANHTAMYCNGRIYQACHDERGGIVGAQAGDQDGTEISSCGWYNFPWNCVLRYKDTTPSFSNATESVADDEWYTVQGGDNLWMIADRFLGDGCRYGDIIAWNKLTSDYLQIGQRIRIKAPAEKKTEEEPKTGASSPIVNEHFYVVQKGDSLWKIANDQLGKGWRYTDIAKLNGIKFPYVIHAGDTLQIPND